MQHRALFHVILGVACAAALAYFGLQTATQFAMSEGRGRVAATLSLTLQALDGHLRRFESVPGLLAENDLVRTVLEDPGDPAGRGMLDLWLVQKSVQLAALDIFVMTPDGATVAASNHDRADTFVGQNFSYRP